MVRFVRLNAGFNLALALTFAVSGTCVAHARTQDQQIQASEAQAPIDPARSALPGDITVQPLTDAHVDPAAGTAAEAPTMNAASLHQLVDTIALPATISPEIECMAGAIYFEARSESLAGQLAVARVIVARTASGRFPASYCGVVYQPSQFSFIRHGTMPAINRANRLWQNAVRIAMIAHRGAWKSPAEGALFFHAARIGPMGGRTQVARIENHVFYR